MPLLVPSPTVPIDCDDAFFVSDDTRTVIDGAFCIIDDTRDPHR
jgi:hypothetical protein